MDDFMPTMKTLLIIMILIGTASSLIELDNVKKEYEALQIKYNQAFEFNNTYVQVAKGLYYPKGDQVNITLTGITYSEYIEYCNHEWLHHVYHKEHFEWW